MKAFSYKLNLSTLVLCLLTLNACDRNNAEISTVAPAPAVTVNEKAAMQIVTAPEVIEQAAPVQSRQFNIGNTQYLFDVSDNSPEELEALLQRAEEIRDANAEGYDDLEIVLVLHGPDINIFRQKNYDKHKPLVDLAAKLDAFDIIDMKMCETAMSSLGVDRSEVPAFIESVPYGYDEIRRLEEEGYINL